MVDIPAVLAAGLPNITANDFSGNPNTGGSGAIYNAGNSDNTVGAGQTYWRLYAFDARRSNEIYGNSDTVQPPALQLIPQIKF